MLRGVISRPEYAHGDDGLDALMSEGTLYYAIQGRVFAGDAFVSRNFRVATTLSRNVRRARVTDAKIPAGQSPLGEYHDSYRKYISQRNKNRREDEIVKEKMRSDRKANECRAEPSSTTLIANPKSETHREDVWKWTQWK